MTMGLQELQKHWNPCRRRGYDDGRQRRCLVQIKIKRCQIQEIVGHVLQALRPCVDSDLAWLND